MQQTTTRRATESDLPAVLGLLAHLHPGDPPPDPARAAAAWAAMLGSGLLSLWLAEAAGVPAASCSLVTVPNLTRGARPYGVIENVVTHPEHRCRGLGRAVLAAALAEAWQAGCYKVMLATGSTQAATLRFYEGAGFHRGKTAFQIRRP